MIRLLPLIILLSACSSENDNDPGVGGVTAGEARALNDAAAKLDSGAYDPVSNNSAAARR